MTEDAKQQGVPPLDNESSLAEDADLLDLFWNDLVRDRAIDSGTWLETNAVERGELAPELEVLNLLFEARRADKPQSSTVPCEQASQGTRLPTEPVLPEGKLVAGRLRVLKRLDAGGMGEVYLAWHMALECEVAVKVLPKRLMRNEEAVKLFEEGIKAHAKLRAHENIVAVLDAGKQDEFLYLVMEHVPGINLGNLVRRHGRRGWRESCHHIRQAALALEYAHAKGIVHRDVKPANLMFGPNGTVKLLDWGLAHVTPDLLENDDAARSRRGMGTLDFMAPEQAADPQSVGPASDLYGLGATWYLLLIGRPPFSAHKTTHAKLRAHRSGSVPSVLAERPDVPPEVDSLIRQLMAKSPSQRVHSARELVIQLDAIVGGKSTSHRRSLPAVLTTGLVFVLLAITAGAMWWYLKDQTQNSPESPTVPKQLLRTNGNLRSDSGDAESFIMQGDALAAAGQLDQAIAKYDAALDLNPECTLAYCNRALAWSSKGAYERATADYFRAEQLQPASIPFYADNNLAWILATCPDEKYRDGKRAIEYATKACQKTNWKNANTVSTLAAAYAEAGQFDAAIRWQNEAIRLTPDVVRGELHSTLELYQHHVPLRSRSAGHASRTEGEY